MRHHQGPQQPLPTGVTNPACTVCGNRDYGPGPNGRMSREGLSPRCSRCGSLERHRRLRTLYGAMPGQWLATLAVLQLSPDIGVDPGWFRSYEVSEFGGGNSLDLEHIDRPDRSYDLVICNHVLEHVADDRQGFRELLRVAATLVQITVPSPFTRARTVDWGYPKAEAHGHYRGYGRDVVRMFLEADPDVHVVQVEVVDPVTDEGDYIYLCSRDPDHLRGLRSLGKHSELFSGSGGRAPG